MTDLHVIRELFADLDGSTRYHEQLELWIWVARQLRREKNTRDQRIYRRRHPDKRVAAKQRWREKYPEKARAQWRRHTAAYRARKRAALAA